MTDKTSDLLGTITVELYSMCGSDSRVDQACEATKGLEQELYRAARCYLNKRKHGKRVSVRTEG